MCAIPVPPLYPFEDDKAILQFGIEVLQDSLDRALALEVVE